MTTHTLGFDLVEERLCIEDTLLSYFFQSAVKSKSF